MRKALVTLLLLYLAWAPALAHYVALPDSSIALTTQAGQELLLGSDCKAAYWPLAAHYETELGLSHCGPASAVMVLNGLSVLERGISAPATLTHPPFRMFEQDGFFTPATDRILTEAQLRRQGATLEELAAMIAAHGATVELHHAGDVTVEDFRRQARHASGTSGEFVIINFLRAPLAQQGGGHFSPLAAYHGGSDRFLVMDVARYKYPPFWTRADDLYRAMNTVDATSGKTRGYIIARCRAFPEATQTSP